MSLPTPLSEHALRRREVLTSLAPPLAFQAYILLGRPSLAVDVAVLAALAVVTVWILRARGEGLASLGLTRDGHLAPALRVLLPAVALFAALFCGYRALWGPLAPRPWFPGILLGLAIYPLWGLAQQSLYLGLVYRGLVRAGASQGVSAGVAALLYAAIHLPNAPLTGVCLLLGALLTAVYRKEPSLLAAGLAHGIGGAFALHVLALDLEIGATYLRAR